MGFVSKFAIPVSVSFAIHAGVFWALIAGWSAKPEPLRIVPPTFIEAKVVRIDSKSKKKASARKQPKKIDLTAQRRAREDIRRQTKQKKTSRATEKTTDIEAKPRPQKVEREQTARLQKEMQEQKARAKQLRLQQAFEEALLEEQGLLQEEEFAAEAQSFTSSIQQRVKQNWSRPPSARTGMRCMLKIQLVPTGRIVSVTVLESSGNAAFDRSAMQAVKKVDVFPEVKEMSTDVFERYYRTFNFLFDPQDLRL